MSVTADLGTPIASTSEERQIAIRLSTKDSQYTIPPAKFLVPASWRRFQLSELINKVLENGKQPSSLLCALSFLPSFEFGKNSLSPPFL